MVQVLPEFHRRNWVTNSKSIEQMEKAVGIKVVSFSVHRLLTEARISDHCHRAQHQQRGSWPLRGRQACPSGPHECSLQEGLCQGLQESQRQGLLSDQGGVEDDLGRLQDLVEEACCGWWRPRGHRRPVLSLWWLRASLSH